jgi:GNAT superfamily N-acetyltransferase
MGEAEGGVASDEGNIGALVEAWRTIVGRIPGATLEHSDGVATTFGHVSLPLMNVSVLDRASADEADLRRALGVARERARSCIHPTLVALCPGWAPPRWRSIAAEAGLELSDSMTGMAADVLAPPRRPAPPIDLRLVGPATAADIAVVNADAYGMPLETAQFISCPDIWTKDTFGVVGYVGGKAVTCTAAFVIGEMIYVALVATVREAHGKGYAEAVMRRAIRQAQDAAGQKRIWLHATAMGQPLYHSMGFATGAEIPLLAFGDGH